MAEPEPIISFWEKLLHKVMVEKTMTMLEAHKRDNLYGFAVHVPGLPTDQWERMIMEMPAEMLPPVIFVLGTDTEARQIRREFAARVASGELTPWAAAQAYYDKIVQIGPLSTRGDT